MYTCTGTPGSETENRNKVKDYRDRILFWLIRISKDTNQVLVVVCLIIIERGGDINLWSISLR